MGARSQRKGSADGGPARAALAGPTLLGLILVAILASTGCTRTFWRRQADLDAYSLVREKATLPHWRLPNYTVAIDPRSRMYDPYMIDCSPMPPDDPTAHQFMHCVDNKRGWPFWHDNGDRPYVENMAWPEYINIDDRGVLKLSVDDAVRLALLHSKDYQQQLETVYLSALDVSIERFRFDSQFFAGYTTFGTWGGPAAPAATRGSQLTSSTFTNRSGAVPLGNLTNSSTPGILGAPGTSGMWSVNKAFTTGGQLVVNFANQLVWQFSGNDNFTPTTVLNFAMVQPLLRGAGRDRIMEQLTLIERNLLYNVRIMEQYRQAFYVDTVVGGGTNGSTPNRLGSGGALGQGLSGFSGVGANGFGTIALQGTGGGTNPAPQGAQNFIGLLQQQRIVRNQEDAVRRLRRNLSRLNILLEQQPPEQTGEYLTQALQVAQTRQALLGNEVNLINLRNSYLASLDTFKVGELYLPPQICIEPSDPLLNPFDLIDQAIIRLPEDWEDVLLSNPEGRRAIPERIQSNVEVVAREGAPPMCRLKRYPELEEDLLKLRPAFAQMQRFAEEITQSYLPTIREDVEKMKAAVPRRKAYLQRLIDRIAAAKENPCDLLPLRVDPLETAGGRVAADMLTRLDASLANAERSFENLNANFTRYAEALAERGRVIDRLMQDNTQPPEQLFELLVRNVFDPTYECGQTRVLTNDVVEEMTRELIELQLLQAVARTETIEVNEVDVRFDATLNAARRYRRDWMNARGSLVDSWRRLQYNADQLQAQLDVFLTGTMNNVDDNNPFSLRANTGTLRAGVQFDTPLNRMSERNSYRQSLIEYQQARRNFYNFEDRIAQALRGYLRQITAFQINFETNRLAVIEAARQVMLNTFIDQENQRTATTRVTAARDAVQGLTDLNNAQNQFMLTFITYEIARLQLDFNMGTMQLDNEGLWIDPGKMGQDYGQFDPWVWRNSPGSIGEGTTDNDAGELDRKIDELPPPFLLPSAELEPLPPVPTGQLPAPPPTSRER
ncbi:MAG TPA: TolC family protein [Pirellulaceae bacterium]